MPLLLAWMAVGMAVGMAVAPAAFAQVVSSTMVESDNPFQISTSASVFGTNVAGNPTDPACAVLPQPLECANSTASVVTPVVRRWTTSIPTRRADLVLTKTDNVDVAVPGTSVTYTITVENPSATMNRLFGVKLGAIFEIDPADGTIIGGFSSPVSPTEDIIFGSFGLASTETTLWAAGSRLDPIVELDPDTGATLREIPNPGLEVKALAFRDGELFAIDEDTEISRYRLVVFDALTGEVRRVLTSYDESDFTLGDGLAATNDRLIVGPGGNGENLFEVDPMDRRAKLVEFLEDNGIDGLDGANGVGAIGNLLYIAPQDSENGIRVYEGRNLPPEDTLPTQILPLFELAALGADHYEQRSDVLGATVIDNFAPELSCTWTCVSEGAATCTAGPVSGDINDSVDIPLDSLVTYTAVCDISPSATGTLENTASVAGGDDYFEVDPSNDFATDVDSLVATSDLAVTKTDDRDPIGAGAILTYTVTVDNPGPSDATSVVVAETLPGEVTLVSTSGCTNDPTGAPNCMLGTIAAGGSASFDVEVMVDVDVASDTLLNEVSVSSASVDLEATNDVADEETQVDNMPPTITVVSSLADTGDGLLEECEEARVDITQLLVTFSKPVVDPIGDSDPADVTNPSNYRLIAAGPDGDFETATCGGAIGDDLLVTVDAVTYAAGPQIATLALNTGTPLTDDLYRLLVCGGPGIEDLSGNALDGDNDGGVGGDFVRTYRVERDNLFRNGHLDCEVDPWIAVSTDPNEIIYSTDDVQDSSVSGSAAFTNLTESLAFSIGQCPDVMGDASYAFSAAVRVEAADDALLLLSRRCEFFAESGCAGEPLSSELTFDILNDTEGVWAPRTLVVSSPVATQSVLCSFELSVPEGDDFDVFFDDLQLSLLEDLFADGFELGNTSAWSETVP